MWNENYRQLEEGEIIKKGDEVLNDKTLEWEPVISIGKPAPHPLFTTSHRMIRRKKSRGDDKQ